MLHMAVVMGGVIGAVIFLSLAVFIVVFAITAVRRS